MQIAIDDLTDRLKADEIRRSCIAANLESYLEDAAMARAEIENIDARMVDISAAIAALKAAAPSA